MEDFLREILACSPSLSHSSLPLDSPTIPMFSESSAPTTIAGFDWDSEVEMQRLLAMVPADVNSTTVDTVDIAQTLLLEPNGGLDLDILMASSGIGVF